MCEYTSGQVCEASGGLSHSSGDMCETRVAMMREDEETFTNGHGEAEQVSFVKPSTPERVSRCGSCRLSPGSCLL